MIYFALTALGFVLANVLNAFAARYIPQHFLVVMHALLRRPNEWAFFNLRNGPVIFLVGPQKWLANSLCDDRDSIHAIEVKVEAIEKPGVTIGTIATPAPVPTISARC